MPKTVSIQNNFTRGLITEATGLNFPENACTETQNCVFTLIGDVTRRPGINYETNHVVVPGTVVSNAAVSSFKWVNAGGDGETEIMVIQGGALLHFFQSTNSTVADPLSATYIGNVGFSNFQVSGNINPIGYTECQFAAGNGYLFVFHPDCDPFYCVFNNGTVLSNKITIQIRDFLGFYPEPGNEPFVRPSYITVEHQYNLENQGWTGAPAWVAAENNAINNAAYTNLTVNNNNGGGGTMAATTGNVTFTVQSSTIVGIQAGQVITLTWLVKNQAYLNVATGSITYGDVSETATGSVVSYTGNQLVVDVSQVTTFTNAPGIAFDFSGSIVFNRGVFWTIVPGVVSDSIDTFFAKTGVYPADCDIWYTFKDSTGVFSPGTMLGNVLTTSTFAPRGHFILNAFNQDKAGISNLAVTNLTTVNRPSTGAWFQGRVWYTGVNASQQATGDQGYYTWSENIYFSQVITQGDATSFGNCYQQNDPTSELLFNLLATDGGVVTIEGSGFIKKLFPIQNGMLIFADNGVWFLRGNQGLGFTADDYTLTKISSVRTLSACSFIDVLGLPYFWNEEGIYRVTMSQGNAPYGFGGLNVEPLTIGTILAFYNEIPLDSKIYARGDYDPINYVIKWVYRSTQEIGIHNRYFYDSVLNFNLHNSAFYPYRVSSTDSTPYMNGLFYLSYPNSSSAPSPSFKYIASSGPAISFAEENDTTTWLDWGSQNFVSDFTTGYSLQGKGMMKHQPIYTYVYSRNDVPFAYTIQGVWDYSINPNSGKHTVIQTVYNQTGQPNFGQLYRRHKIRGHGEVLQLYFSSVQGQPFDFIGWVIPTLVDAGV